jgi:poly-gamma-glutamate capsule biosynthesis protein CapA/YwtB (metallophosphatase superfamily)
MHASEQTLFLAGDTMLTQPWSGVDDRDFLRLVAEMRAADTTILNLETVIHTFKGYPQADCGGTYMTSPPQIANELRWAGVNMVSNANNHAFDYGSIGVLETLEHCRAAGLIVAGIGENLQESQSPRFARNGGLTVSLVSMASSFIHYGSASLARHDVPGRPGLNPLHMTRLPVVSVTPKQRAALGRLAGFLGRGSARYYHGSFWIGPLRFRTGEKLTLEAGRRFDRLDRARNLTSIEAAHKAAGITVVSIHAHYQAACLPRFSREAIEHGADVVFVHGPHEVRGIELHLGKPIFYCLGDFVYQPDQVSRFPAEAYQQLGLPPDAAREEYDGDGLGSDLQQKRSVYEAVAAVVEYRDTKVWRIRLIPIDLQFDAPPGTRGRPRWAAPDLGRRIIGKVASHSARCGCLVEYDATSNCGIIEPARARRG